MSDISRSAREAAQTICDGAHIGKFDNHYRSHTEAIIQQAINSETQTLREALRSAIRWVPLEVLDHIEHGLNHDVLWSDEYVSDITTIRRALGKD